MRPPLADSLPLIGLLVGLVVIAALLAAAEAAMLRVPRVRVEVLAEEGDRRALRLQALVKDLTRVLNTVLLAVLLTQVGAATVAGFLAERHFGNAAVTVASVILTLVMFVYTEAIPKTMAVHHPITVGRLLATPITVLTWVFRPVVTALVAFADIQAPGRGIPSSATITERELRRLAAEAEAAGEIDASDLDLIERAFHVGDERVAAILVPRPEIVAIKTGTDLREALQKALESGHRRLPIYGEDVDDITGVVAFRDLAAAVAADDRGTVDDLVRPILVVPESQRIIAVLRAMQEDGRHMAAVIDEHGGIAGIVTIEDIAEELVGEIADEDQVSTPQLRAVGPGRWVALGTTPLWELDSRFDASFDVDDVHTVAGLVLTLAGRVPRPGDVFDKNGFRFRVISATRRRVHARGDPEGSMRFDQQVTFLFVDDLERSAEFYGDVMGLELVLDQGSCRIYRAAPSAFLGICHRPGRVDPDGVIVTFVTSEVEAAHARLVEAGAVCEKPPTYYAEYDIFHAFFRDPDGHLVEVQRFCDPAWPAATTQGDSSG